MIINEWTDERMDSWIDRKNGWIDWCGEWWMKSWIGGRIEGTKGRTKEGTNGGMTLMSRYLRCHIMILAAHLPTPTKSTNLHRGLLLYCFNFLSISVTFCALMSTLRVIALYPVVRYNGGNYPIIPFTNMTNGVISYCPIYWIKVSEQNL